ncbi:MAG: zinc-ribbon domain-containing protein, partial [Candidatus Nitrosomaritimum aestuariumsis]
EIRKSLKPGSGGTQSPGLMPGMGAPGMAGGMGMPQAPRPGTSDNPVGGPPGIVSAGQAFGEPGTLPTPDPALMPRQMSGANNCSSCGSPLRANAKFCTKCGNKL